ncbi:MAG: shikimate kinase [Bacteroidota bacterium]|jgi:shikimate kinase
MEKRIFLIGFMGSGKSFLGRAMASEWAIPFVDLDHFIENTGGGHFSIAKIFETHGEAFFRTLEAQQLEKIINDFKTILLATGGGTPCFHENMALMNQQGITIYLRTPPDLLVERLLQTSELDKRPLLRHKNQAALLDFVLQKLNERQSFYESAQIIIDQKDNDLEKTITAIETELGKLF